MFDGIDGMAGYGDGDAWPINESSISDRPDSFLQDLTVEAVRADGGLQEAAEIYKMATEPNIADTPLSQSLVKLADDIVGMKPGFAPGSLLDSAIIDSIANGSSIDSRYFSAVGSVARNYANHAVKDACHFFCIDELHTYRTELFSGTDWECNPGATPDAYDNMIGFDSSRIVSEISRYGKEDVYSAAGHEVGHHLVDQCFPGISRIANEAVSDAFSALYMGSAGYDIGGTLRFHQDNPCDPEMYPSPGERCAISEEWYELGQQHRNSDFQTIIGDTNIIGKLKNLIDRYQ